MNNTYLENIIFFYIISHMELVLSFKPNYFTSGLLKKLYDIIKPHIIEYKQEPTELQVIDLIKIYNKELEIPLDAVHTLWESRSMVTQYTDEWLSSNVKAFGEWQNLMDGLKRVIEYVKTILSDVTFENCSDIVLKAKTIFLSETNFTLNNSKGHDFFDPTNHQQAQLDTRTTGYNFIDQCLKGGWTNKTLNIFMGSPKVGKSMWLCNLCANSVKNGENSAYITLEMPYQLVSLRIGSNLFNIEIDKYNDYANDLDLMRRKIKEFFDNSLIAPGHLIIEEFPTSSATVYDLEAFLLKKEEELSTDTKPFKFKNIYIDYVNIMKDAKNPNSENMYIKIKSICEDVRAMSLRNNWCTISLTLTNRSAYESSDISMSNVSESGGLIATVDSLFGIIQSAVMRTENKYYIKAVAIRNSGHMGDKKGYNFNLKYLRIEEDINEGIISENQSLEIVKKQETNKYPTYNTVPPRPAVPSYNIELPQLGLTETLLTAKSLFEM